MKKQKKRMKVVSPVMTLGLFVLAVALLLGSSIGGTRAALTYYSETYTSRIQMYDIGVTLLENDKAISWQLQQRRGRDLGHTAGRAFKGDAGRGGGIGPWEEVPGGLESPQYGNHQ